jgi:hypothetical protein
MTLIPSTYMSIHAIDEIHAVSGFSIGSPVVLNLGSMHGGTQITLFFADGDEDYAKRLVDAINGVQRQPEPPDAAHAAAQAAASALYGDINA